MPVYRNGSDYSDRDNGGVDISAALDRLQHKKRGKGRLPPATPRDAIGVAVSEAVPAGVEPGTGSGSGPVSPFVEQPYTGSTYYYKVSSNGLYVEEYGHEVTVIDDDGAGNTYVTKLIDPSA